MIVVVGVGKVDVEEVTVKEGVTDLLIAGWSGSPTSNVL